MMRLLVLNAVFFGMVLVLVRADFDYEFENETEEMNETTGYITCAKEYGGFEIKQLFDNETIRILFDGIFSGTFAEKMEEYPEYRSYLQSCCRITLFAKSPLLDNNQDQYGPTAWEKQLNRSYDILTCTNKYGTIRFQKMDDAQDGKPFCQIFPDEKNRQNLTKSLLHVVSVDMKSNGKSGCSEYKLRTNSSKPKEKREVDEFAIEEISIPIGGLKHPHRRLRHLDACSFPTKLETAAISCRIYPSSIECIQSCAFGYTLEDGIQQKMECKYKENKWVPKGFKECQPFVDCTLSLISGGSSKCSSMSLTRGTECRVECLHYEDKPTVPETTYSCDIEGNWDPPLPFCVIPKSGLALVKAPRIKLHDEYYD